MGQIRTWFKQYSLVLLWLIFLAWMCHDYWIARPPVLGADQGYNQDGELQRNVVFSLLEIGILYAILRPRSASVRSLKRFLVAFGLFFPWLCFSILLTMYAGSVSTIHFLWLLLVNAGLIVASALSSAILARSVLRKTD